MHSRPPLSPRWWQWLTVLSLDAPAVAVTWQCLLAHVAEVRLSWAPVFILGASVWLAYAFDRWLEGLRLQPHEVKTTRHAFYQRHRGSVAVIWVLVLLTDVAVSIAELGRREFLAGLILLAPVALYLLSHQLIHRLNEWRVPKEICVAFLITGGVGVFLASPPHANLEALTGPLVLLLVLCFSNCALISAWEHHVDLSQGQTSLSVTFDRAALFSRIVPWLLALASLLAAWRWTGASRTAALCVVASCALLIVLDRLERAVGWRVARVLVDLTLLTPLAPLLVAAVSR